MKPVKFIEQNITFTKPKSMTDKECGELPAFRDDEKIVSCWRTSLKDRIKVLFTGRVWLGITSTVQPPAYLMVERPFIKRPKWAEPNTFEVGEDGNVYAICKETGCLALVYKAKVRKEN